METRACRARGDLRASCFLVDNRRVALTRFISARSFSRLAFIQAYRERQANPSLAAQPGANPTSIRLGGAHGAAAAAAAGPTAAGAARGPTPKPSRAGSPAMSVASGRPAPAPKKGGGGARAAGGDAMSDSGSGIGGQVNTAQQQKKVAKLGVNDPGLPLDSVERERVLAERKKAQQVQKKAQAQKRKEKKRLEQQGHDLSVGTPGSSGVSTPKWA